MFADSIVLGSLLPSLNNYSSLAHTTNGSGVPNIYSDFGFIASGKTLDKFRIYCSAASGLNSVVCEIRAEKTAGLGPTANGTALATVTKTTGLPTGAGWVEFSGFNFASSPGVQYYAVLYNNSSGASPSVTFAYLTAAYSVPQAGSVNTVGFNKVHGTDGTTFSTAGSYAVAGPLLVYTDGSTQGIPCQAASYGVATRFYNAVEWGIKFKTSRDAILNLASCYMSLSTKNNSPTGNISMKVYENSYLVYTTSTIMDATIATSRAIWGGLPVRLKPDTVYRVVAANSGGDATNYNKGFSHTIDSSYANSIVPMLDNFQMTQGSSGAWTDTPGTFPCICLLLDPKRPFLPTPLNRRTYSGR